MMLDGILLCCSGLLGGHVMATYFKKKRRAMEWYNGELLMMAKDVGYHLLPAFNTTTGVPYPRVCGIVAKGDNLFSRKYLHCIMKL